MSAAAAVEGADEVLDLREGDAVVYELDDWEGCFSPDGTDWTADVEEEEEVHSMTRAVWCCAHRRSLFVLSLIAVRGWRARHFRRV